MFLFILLFLPSVDSALSCPPLCSCISNSFARADIETTVVDCSFRKFTHFPITLPNSTTELFLQGSGIETLDPIIYSTAFTREGTAFTTPLTSLEVLRLDKNPLSNISFDVLDGENFAKLKWIYLPRDIHVLEKTPLKLIDHGIAAGWRAIDSNPLENRDYLVWTRDTYTPIVDSSKPLF